MSDLHGPSLTTWFARGVYPTCICGFSPKDNRTLMQHFAAHGFRVVDKGGTLVKIPVSGNSASIPTMTVSEVTSHDEAV